MRHSPSFDFTGQSTGRAAVARCDRIGLYGAFVVTCALALVMGVSTPGAHARSPVGQSGPQSVAPIAKKLVDAVVNISTAQKVKSRSGRPLPSVPEGSPFEDLFEDFFENGEDDANRKVASLGSGFVINGTEGLVVTNNHVIEGADEITIIFRDGSRLPVDKVLGVDKKTDLALLKVTPKTPLPDVQFGSSAAIEVGDWVLAIGNPFGLGGSVSVGIISAKQRDIKTGPYDDYLQTDAAINKGNSGGPLFNMDGDVIGVNTAIISPTGGSIGIGFAVPSDTALLVVEQLRKYGETRRGWLGVNIQSVTEVVATSFGLKPDNGAVISSVAEGGPAEAAGLQPGDVIVAFDGKDIQQMRMLPRLVAQTEEGAEVEVVYLRDGTRETATVTVGRLDESTDEENADADAEANGDDGGDGVGEGLGVVPDGPLLGLTLTPVDAAAVRTYGLKDGIDGLVIDQVVAGTAAEKRGLAPGEVISDAGASVSTLVSVRSRSDLFGLIDTIRDGNRSKILLRVVKPDGQFRFVDLPVE